MMTTLSYIAIAVLAFSYWLQIWKIHKHREVRDLSIGYHILLAIGFGILAIVALSKDGAEVFAIKNTLTFIPVLIIIAQIIWHGYIRHDHWHDDGDPNCSYCEEELEIDWSHCPYCGTEKFRIKQ
jgi:uncharacterized protein with PQ loop repeat